LLAVTKQSLQVATGKGVLEILEIQVAGSKRMPVAQFLAGHRISPGGQLGTTV
jgi:methionyl-tRNA formyltransferase